jgi:hypothetical protein
MPSIEYMVRNAQHATQRRLFLLEKTKRRVTAQRTLFLFPFSVLRLDAIDANSVGRGRP